MNTVIDLPETIPGRLFAHALRRGDEVALHVLKDSSMTTLTWDRLVREACSYADWYRASGVQAGDVVISIETAQPKLDCAVLAKLPEKKILLGVIDLDDMTVETPEVVASRIRRALSYTKAENIFVAPDCGMKYLPREVAYGKMAAMVAGARLVLEELAKAP